MEAKKVVPACRDGCYEQVKKEARDAINLNFWNLKSYNLQNKYISQHVRECKIKRRYGRGIRSERSQYQYSVKYKDDTFNVCAVAFRNIHVINNSETSVKCNRVL